MSLLASAMYDPAAEVSKSTEARLKMTALDTTNLRLKFKAPANGAVLVRLKGQVIGATTFPRILLGVLEGATLKGRVSPIGSSPTFLAATLMAQEALYVITGLESGKEYTWDAAYGVDILLAATHLKYGGPDNATGANAFGAFIFEVWEANELLAGTLYDPTTADTTHGVGTSLLAMTALDTTNLRLKFKAPASGKVLWRINTQQHGSTTRGVYLLGVLESATVKGRTAPIMGNPTTNVETSAASQEASGIVTGLTPETEYTWDAAYGVQVISGAGGLKWGGPDDTTTNNCFGGFAFEIWKA
jgi:hypothetical protein